MSKRFCEQCGAALPPDAHFCEFCGVRVDAPVRAELPPSLPPGALRAAEGPAGARRGPTSGPPPLFRRNAEPPHRPVRQGSGAWPLLIGLALGLLMLAGAAYWWFESAAEDARLERRVDRATPTPSPTSRTPAVDPEAAIPGRAPPTAGGSRSSVSAADEVPVTSAGAAVSAHSETGDTLPPIPITDDPVDLDQLKALVTAANARDIDALYAASPGQRGPESRAALDAAIRALAKGLYRHHVIDGHGDVGSARSELRQFLTALEHKGLGLSDEAIEDGVANVGP